jgi:hypothetical protein
MDAVIDVSNRPLEAWESFYVIVGSSGAALIGLQFVVITLLAGLRKRALIDAINAFGTPTVVNLAGALVISALMSAPWPSLFPAGLALALYGLGGIAYCQVVFRRARRQTRYTPEIEDWVWYVIVPSCVYGALALGALLLSAATRGALFMIAGAALSLLLIGIRNAWDTVIHLVAVEFPDDSAHDEVPAPK